MINNWYPAHWIFCRLLLVHQVLLLFTHTGVHIHTLPLTDCIWIAKIIQKHIKSNASNLFKWKFICVSSFCLLYVHFPFFCRTLHRFRPKVHPEQYATSTSTWCTTPRSLVVFTTQQLKRPQTSCARWGDQHHPHWLRDGQQISPSWALITWAWWCQVRAVSDLPGLFYCHSQSGMSTSHGPPLPCNHCQRDDPSQKELSQVWKNGRCFIFLSIKSLLNVKQCQTAREEKEQKST